jgi:hypothetical protein
MEIEHGIAGMAQWSLYLINLLYVIKLRLNKNKITPYQLI